MGLTTDPNDPRLHKTKPDGQNEVYLVLSDEERAKGFVRPLRTEYRHVGIRPEYELADLTPEEQERYASAGYVKYEAYPEHTGKLGRFWTNDQLNSGCRGVTTMGLALSETYARDPKFYGSTFCCQCGKHFPVEQFRWTADGDRVGS